MLVLSLACQVGTRSPTLRLGEKLFHSRERATKSLLEGSHLVASFPNFLPTSLDSRAHLRGYTPQPSGTR